MAQTVSVIIGPEDRARLTAILGDRNRPLTVPAHHIGKTLALLCRNTLADGVFSLTEGFISGNRRLSQLLLKH